jgi:photosynthetic reaction center cytochrome c subunit
MARDLNSNYLGSLAGVFPPDRLGPTGDVPKVDCATCHQGAYKPLYGADILNGHPGLTGGVKTAAAAAGTPPGPAASPAPEPAAPGPAAAGSPLPPNSATGATSPPEAPPKGSDGGVAAPNSPTAPR